MLLLCGGLHYSTSPLMLDVAEMACHPQQHHGGRRRSGWNCWSSRIYSICWSVSAVQQQRQILNLTIAIKTSFIFRDNCRRMRRRAFEDMVRCLQFIRTHCRAKCLDRGSIFIFAFEQYIYNRLLQCALSLVKLGILLWSHLGDVYLGNIANTLFVIDWIDF